MNNYYENKDGNLLQINICDNPKVDCQIKKDTNWHQISNEKFIEKIKNYEDKIGLEK